MAYSGSRYGLRRSLDLCAQFAISRYKIIEEALDLAQSSSSSIIFAHKRF